MQVKINKPLDVSLLRYGKYLPRAIRGANPILGSWVSPNYINFPNRQFKSDSNTLRGRLKQAAKKSTLPWLVKEAFHEKWFNWRIISKGQTLHNDAIEDNDNPKILLFNISQDLFEGENGYRRYLIIAAVIEYFYTLYGRRFKTVFVVNTYDHKKQKALYTKYNQQLKTKYFVLGSVGLLGSLGILSKIYRLLKTK